MAQRRVIAGHATPAESRERALVPDPYSQQPQLPRVAGGGDVTDLDASGVLDAVVADGRPGSAVRVGVRSGEGPGDMVMRAGLLAGCAEGFARVLEGLLRAAR